MGGEDLDRLAKYVVRRRVQMGYKTREEFASAVGLSVRTLGDIERARRAVGDASVAAVEHALGWRPASFEAILSGREPELESPDKSEPPDQLGHVVGDDPEMRAIWVGLQAISQLTHQERVHMVTLVKALRGTAGGTASQWDTDTQGGGNRHTG
ncbi:helix-turn-helix domain-containing protein [Actinomadura sp. ATCC 39365]